MNCCNWWLKKLETPHWNIYGLWVFIMWIKCWSSIFTKVDLCTGNNLPVLMLLPDFFQAIFGLYIGKKVGVGEEVWSREKSFSQDKLCRVNSAYRYFAKKLLGAYLHPSHRWRERIFYRTLEWKKNGWHDSWPRLTRIKLLTLQPINPKKNSCNKLI